MFIDVLSHYVQLYSFTVFFSKTLLKNFCGFLPSLFFRIIFAFMKKTFTNIEFNTKLHVAHYLTTHFGTPALIPHKHFINKYFKLSLKVRPNHNQKRINLYNTKVEICLYKDALFREGKELTLTSQMNLTNSIDCYIKDQIRLFVDNVLASSKRNENWQKQAIGISKTI